LLAKKFAESLVSQPVLSNHHKIVLS